MKTPALSISLVTAGILLLLAPVAAAGASPVPVSPGGPAGSLAKDTCPAFSWSQGAGGGPYELVVYPVTAEGELGAEPALAARLPAGAQSWTPSADRCLQAGSRYAWSLRDIGDGDWSEPVLFDVALPSQAEVAEALEILRRYLDGGDGAEELAAEQDRLAAELARSVQMPEEPLVVEPAQSLPPADLSVAIVSSLPLPGGQDGLAPVVGASHFSGNAAIHSVEPSTSGLSFGVWAASESTEGVGVYGIARATTGVFPTGVLGVSRASIGMGVSGVATATSGSAIGVSGRSESSGGVGVHGRASATTGFNKGVLGVNFSTQGIGVLGHAIATSGATRGVEGSSDSTQGFGVFGRATATSGGTSGVFGHSSSSQGQGVFGWNLASTGVNQGVNGRSESPDGRGVLGSNISTTGTEAFGVLGISRSTQGEGVFGQATGTTGESVGTRGDNYSTQGRGVFGWALATSGTNYGVFGQTNSPAGYAGYFAGRSKVAGDLIVEGNLTKGGATFKIDHPLDPANQYLSHSFVESPDMMNVYNGNAVLDEEGAAWVELPEYFGALNRDFRYQLTALYRPAPGLYVASGIADNRFRISGGEPGMEVSWQVTGIRQDAYAEKNPIVVEEDKGELRGRYLHPEAHDQPAELAIGYVQPPEMEVAEVPSAPSRAGEQDELANESRGTHGSEASGAKPTLARSSLETDPTEGDRR